MTTITRKISFRQRLTEYERYVESIRQLLCTRVWDAQDIVRFNELVDQSQQFSAELANIKVVFVKRLGDITQKIKTDESINEYFKELKRGAYQKKGGPTVRAGKALYDVLKKKEQGINGLIRICDSLSDSLAILRPKLLQKWVFMLLEAGDRDGAENFYQERCGEWWPRSDYEAAVKHAQDEQARKAAEEEARKLAAARERLREQVRDLLDAAKYVEADRLYQERCSDWWNRSDYEARKIRARFIQRFKKTYHRGALAELDMLYINRPPSVHFSMEKFIARKLPKIRNHLAPIGIQLDEEQEQALARPESRLLIKARAGSGKTRTLCARAVLTIRDEKLDPNQVLILAFNKDAAAEVRSRVQRMAEVPDFENARTFHSLAYQLVKPNKKLLFDAGGHPSKREQGRFVQRMMQRILNPAFKEAMVEFFRKELEQVKDLGRDLPPNEYFVFRRAMEMVTLGGDRVKSNGEKFIADFLFEHGIEYRYERAWQWKSDFLDGGAYRPDFSIVANGRDYILEHWAIDPDDRSAEVPEHWDISTDQYRRQIHAKRRFWQSRGIPLLETHAGLIREGREAFERRLGSILQRAGIPCRRLPKEEIVRRVFENDFAISRMAKLFQQFIQRAKKRGWTPNEVVRRFTEAPDREPRTRLFHQLALRAYREYEAVLEERQAMDFDDLLVQAVEEVEARGASASIHLGQGCMFPISYLKWILLDEYQDFSELYFRMLNAILKAKPDIRLVAVGDDWQAINGFAGAEPRFFERFADYFPGAESVGVTTNYRSDRAVVGAGNRLMDGRGSPAKVSRSAEGKIEIKYLGDVWIEFRQGEPFQQERESDALYLPPRPEGRNPSERALKQAQALKQCAEIILEAPDQTTMLLARTNKVYGIELDQFKDRLIEVLCALRKEIAADLEKSIATATAHRSKGREAHRVIILDATQRQFPKLHPDNFLFKLFGVTPHAVLEEERRLFYVALTRAEHDLYILTEKGEESPFIEEIYDQESHSGKSRFLREIPSEHLEDVW
ncbi:UvrD-helicase domain-containing protein [Methylohalobius crimeensis]|uniref:UvrD-helicase domain-containing protein n=1 Tax=Methylohalobius crimeensis TaxID=244365 RepID=UPI000A04F1AD|nr:UvrD-helicase domain-containing protein [Methylohalobius crimeensis]